MRIVCVDDEQIVLELTVSLCEELRQKPEVAGYQNAEDALCDIAGSKTDIAILDINMPHMDGLELAAKIKEESPDTSIIFLTGYEYYAVDAFRLHASGYLMKPVNRDCLQAEVNYALEEKNPVPKPTEIVIRTFGEFDVFVNNQVVNFARSRSKELLAYLVDRNGGSVTRAAAHAVLWEEGPYDRAMQKQLDVIIRSLRETLHANGISDIFELSNGKMRICPEKFSCDLYLFFQGDVDAMNAYRGEYMAAYSWASLTEAYMDHINRIAQGTDSDTSFFSL